MALRPGISSAARRCVVRRDVAALLVAAACLAPRDVPAITLDRLLALPLETLLALPVTACVADPPCAARMKPDA